MGKFLYCCIVSEGCKRADFSNLKCYWRYLTFIFSVIRYAFWPLVSQTLAILSITQHMTAWNHSTPAFTGFAAGVKLSTTPVATTSINDIGGKFATCTAGAPGAPWLSENFWKNQKDPNVILRGLGGDDLWKQLEAKKSRDTFPLNEPLYECLTEVFSVIFFFCPGIAIIQKYAYVERSDIGFKFWLSMYHSFLNISLLKSENKLDFTWNGCKGTKSTDLYSITVPWYNSSSSIEKWRYYKFSSVYRRNTCSLVIILNLIPCSSQFELEAISIWINTY